MNEIIFEGKYESQLTLMVLFKHSSATILTSDSVSSHSVRNVSSAMPRNLGKSVCERRPALQIQSQTVLQLAARSLWPSTASFFLQCAKKLPWIYCRGFQPFSCHSPFKGPATSPLPPVVSERHKQLLKIFQCCRHLMPPLRWPYSQLKGNPPSVQNHRPTEMVQSPAKFHWPFSVRTTAFGRTWRRYLYLCEIRSIGGKFAFLRFKCHTYS